MSDFLARQAARKPSMPEEVNPATITEYADYLREGYPTVGPAVDLIMHIWDRGDIDQHGAVRGLTVLGAVGFEGFIRQLSATGSNT